MDEARRLSAIPHEARPFQGHRAGLVTRTMAAVADAVCVVAILAGGYLAWSGLLFVINPPGFDFPRFPFLGWLGAAYVITVGYLGLGWATTGRTPGARLLGLRVVNHRGVRVRPVAALLRALFCAAVPIGLLWIAASPQNRSLQDTVLRTSVVYDWQPARVTARDRGEPSGD